MRKFYVIFMPVEVKGVYDSWEECKAILDKCKNGKSFVSVKNKIEAARALSCGSLEAYRRQGVDSKQWKTPSKDGSSVVELPCLVVDAACSGAPGPTEYRGVLLPEKEVVFAQGPYVNGTNNVGEYLGIVTGLRWLEKMGLPYPLYSDSACAIGWVKGKGTCNSKCTNLGAELRMLVGRAESWMRGPTSGNMVGRLRKWDTGSWGEIPADYDRK